MLSMIISTVDSSVTPTAQAMAELYATALGRGRRWRLWAWLRGRRTGLRDLGTMEAGGRVSSRHALGVQSVPLAAITGSEGRSADFDAAFYPRRAHTRARWQRVAAARAADLPLPAIVLIQIGDEYYVRDGHHRVSVARAFGAGSIDADVTRWELAPAAAPARCEPACGPPTRTLLQPAKV
jgi:hypothetical protein